MLAVEEKEALGTLKEANRHDHDLVQELNTRLTALWHYGECISDAEGDPESQKMWRELQHQELVNISHIKQAIASRLEKGEFLEDF